MMNKASRADMCALDDHAMVAEAHRVGNFCDDLTG